MNYLLWYVIYFMLTVSCYGAVHVGDPSAWLALVILWVFPLGVPRKGGGVMSEPRVALGNSSDDVLVQEIARISIDEFGNWVGHELDVSDDELVRTKKRLNKLLMEKEVV